MIQTIVVVFLYNEYFNEKELEAIKTQIQETRNLKNTLQLSRTDLINAQHLLADYTQEPSKKKLQAYFESIQSARDHLQSLQMHQDKFYANSKRSLDDEPLNLTAFNQLIDSVYHLTDELKIEHKDFEINEIEVINDFQEYKVEVTHAEDTLPKKRFFSRLKDAVTGKVDVHVDTVYITTVYGQSVNVDEIKQQMDSTVKAVENHYRAELSKYEKHLSQVSGKNMKISKIYENLLDSGNGLMRVYDEMIDGVQSDLENRYYQKNSANAQLRKTSIFGLMLMMLLMLLVLVFYTRASFKLEKDLKSANAQIKKHLGFKNRILGMLSHEVRSPLQIMNIFIGKIDRQIQDAKVKSYLKSMKFTNASLLLQANQILDYAKNEEKKLSLEVFEFNLKEEIKNIADSFRVFIETNGNRFDVHLAINEDCMVNSDAAKIHQLMANLLGNANKFTQNGWIQLKAETVEMAKNKICLKVVIEDSGTGIAESDLKHIFESYYQGVLSQKVQNLGVGLGLNLCRELVDLFDGELKVESQLGKGTKVSFSILLNQTQKTKNDAANIIGR